jgi:hypothetical protein
MASVFIVKGASPSNTHNCEIFGLRIELARDQARMVTPESLVKSRNQLSFINIIVESIYRPFGPPNGSMQANTSYGRISFHEKTPLHPPPGSAPGLRYRSASLQPYFLHIKPNDRVIADNLTSLLFFCPFYRFSMLWKG